jgi:hypothetical protein
MIAESRFVSPDYFATMRIPLVGGERCGQQPVGSARDVVVNREHQGHHFARSTL